MDDWTEAMIELNSFLEEVRNAGVSKEDVLREVDNVFGKE
jgi:hypothetical protein